MSVTTIIVFVTLTLAAFALSALFSGLETGVYTLNRVRLTLRVAAGNRAALLVRHELRRPARVLSVLLIGTNAANYVASYGLAALMRDAGLPDASLILLQATVLALLVFVFAETLPKELFRQHTDRWTYAVFPLISGARWLFTVLPILPIVSIFTFLLRRLTGSPDDTSPSGRVTVSHMIKEGVGAGVLSVTQSTLADRALAYRDERVERVMVPWDDVVTVPVTASAAARSTLLETHPYSRIPVIDDDGRPVGVLSWLDAALGEDRSTRTLMGPATRLARDTRVVDALATLQRQRTRLAIVYDETTDSPIGICTTKNLIEPLTGELGAW